MKLKKILLRLGTENLIKFIDTIVFNVLRLRGSKIINEKNLTEIVLKLNSEKDLLLEKGSRELILGALKNEEAKLICKLFDIGDKDPWNSINKINFKKKKNLDLLFKLFELDTSNKISIDSSEDKTNPLIISPNYSLFFHQIDVLDKVNKPIKKALLHMPTGSGKTRTAINLICDYLKSNPESLVVWLAHTEELCQQAHDEFNKGWGIIGNRNIKSYKLFKSHRYDLNDIKNGFAVLSLDYAYSLTKKEQGKFFSFARKCGFVVMDEAHMSIAPTYKQVLEILVNKSTNLLGLTATPGRTAIAFSSEEEESKKLAIFYNKQKATLKVKGYKTPIHFLQDKGYLAKITRERLETSISDIKKIFSDAEIKAELKRIKNGRDISKEFVKELK